MRVARYLIFFITVILFSNNGISQNPDWNNQISCIVYSHCTSCHNPNGLAPFPLTSYQQVYAMRNSILRSVEEKKMPPYLPNTDYSHFANEKTLKNEEINMIRAWVNAGAPEGNGQSIPQPTFNTSEIINQPDQRLAIPRFTVPVSGNDLYQAFVISNPTNTVRYIDSLELIPGNRNIVHHVLIFQDTSNRVVVNDSSYAGPGYVSFGGVGSNSAKLIATWVPGSEINTFPSGMGIRLEARARIVIQIHYPSNAGGQTDSTYLNVSFSNTPLRNVNLAPVLNSQNLTNGPLIIPANTIKTFHSQYTVQGNATIISIGPHAHLLCKSFECFGILPGGDTLKLIKIDDWDFHWQGNHSFRRPIKIPAGTVLHGYAVYDNTLNNPNNPSSPPQAVSQGEATTDEMMLIYFGFTGYQNGDELIVIDTSSHGKHYMNCEIGTPPVEPSLEQITIFPNPTHNIINIQLPAFIQDFTANVYDMRGRLLKYVINEQQIDVSSLQGGIYILQIQTDKGIIRKKFFKNNSN